ncbi:MAG: GH25 family lysozyme, partial [Marmoricola sp.]
RGMDVSASFGRPSVATWQSTYLTAKAYKFVWVKSTEGTYYTSPNFGGASGQYCADASAGLIPGAYHFANPYDSNGTVQADALANSLRSVSGCSASGRTLPGVLDLEYDPYGHGYCWSLTASQMVAWVRAFDAEYFKQTGTHPVIYTPTTWWNTCTNSSSAFSKTNTFWLPEYNGSSTSGPKNLPVGVATWTFWQNGSQPNPPLDYDFFNGTLAQLQSYATPHTFAVGAHVAPRWTSALGQPTGPEVPATAFGGTGYYQNFANGIGLIASPNGSGGWNVYQSSGLLYQSWTPAAWGWPTGDAVATSAQGINGSTQTFSEGSAGAAEAFATPNYGAALVDGKVLTQYKSLGGPTWGWPTASIVKRTAFGISGASLTVQGGRSIVASSVGTVVNNGADGGAILAAWSPARRGWPTRAMTAVTAQGITGYTQMFGEGTSGAAEAFWTSTYGTSWADGALLTKYQSLGGPSWGWPTNSDKLTAFGIPGSYLTVQGGRAVISTAKYGTFLDGGSDHGVILDSWSPTRTGWPTSSLATVTAHSASGYQQRFARGTQTPTRAFVSSVNSHAVWMSGAILARYDALGGTRVVGWPLAAMTNQTAFGLKGYIQRFQSGRALISSTYGTFSSAGAIFAAWRPSVRGWPTADLKATTYRGHAGWLQTFRRGSTGPDFAFVLRSTGAISWHSGTP